MQRLTTREFITRANAVHGGNYDYHLTVYAHSQQKLSIVCPIHGQFLQRPSDHLAGHGCPDCGRGR